VVEWGLSPSVLYSGGSDGVLYTWDIRTLEYPVATRKIADDEITALTISATDTLVAAGSSVYRLIGSNGIETILECEDDINVMDLHHTGRRLAVADDTGTVSVLDLKTPKKKVTRLTGQHTNLCTAVKFRPKYSWDYLVSGGMDSLLVYWNASTGRPRTRVVHVESFADEDAATTTGLQCLNPPLVHAIDVTDHFYVVAIGDTTIAVRSFDYQNPADPYKLRFVAHRGAVCQAKAVLEHETGLTLVSTSTDRTMALWDIQNVKQPANAKTDDHPSANLLHRWTGIKNKPNWISISPQKETVAIADTSKCISVKSLFN